MARSWYRELTPYHWRVWIAATLGWMFDAMDQRIFVLGRNPALRSLLPPGTSPADITWYSGIATAAFMIGWALGGLFFGVMGDRWGRVRTMTLTIVVYAGFTGLSALAQNQWDFIGYRFLTGLGVGGEFSAGVALIAEVLPDAARPHALGAMQMFSMAGTMAAALLNFVMVPLGWRWMFVCGLFPVVLIPFLLQMKEPAAWHAARAVARERMGSVHDIFSPPWRHNTIVGLVLAIAGVVGIWGIGFWTPELIREVLHGAPAKTANWYVSMGGIVQDAGGFLGMYGFTLLTARVGRRRAFAVAFVIALGATILTFGFMRTTFDMLWMIPLLGAANLSVFAGYGIYFPELYPTRLRSTGVGVCYDVGRVIAALGPFTLGGLTVAFAALGFASPFRGAAIALAFVYLIGLAALPFAPETSKAGLPQEAVPASAK